MPTAEVTLPRITWSEAPDRSHWLTASVSVPKMLWGSNIGSLETDVEIVTGLSAISRFVTQASGIDFEAAEANVTRVNYCFNWQLTPSEVWQYLRALNGAAFPRMTRHIIGTGTVQFSNKSQAVVFYDKLEEAMFRSRNGEATEDEINASVGVLRFENRFLNHRACRRLAARLGLANSRAETLLTTFVAETIMNETISQVGLNQPLESVDSRLELLRECYGFGPQFVRLAGFLALCDEYGAQHLVALGMSRAEYYRKQSELKKAGAWIASPSRRALPPLRIVRSHQQRRDAA